MTEYGEGSHKEKDADSKMEFKPGMMRSSAKTGQRIRQETGERMKGKERKTNAADKNNRKRNTGKKKKLARRGGSKTTNC